MLLSSTTDKYTVDTSSNADSVITFFYSVGDKGTPPMTMKDADSKVTFSNSATAAQDISGSPAGSSDRWKGMGLLVVNNDPTDPCTYTFKYVKAGGTARQCLPAFTLQAGEYAKVDEKGVLFVHDVLGRVKVGGVPGAYIQQTELTSGTTFTTGPNTNKIRIRMVGGGGGGGGCTSVASAAGAGGGGGAGGYAEKEFIVTPNTAYSYAIGAAGNGASGAAGGNGGDTTFTGPGAVTVTAKGGTGAPQAVSANALKTFAGGAGGVVSTNGDLNSGGAPGEYGVVLVQATPTLASGNGGSSQFGAGGLGLVAVGAGNNATGNGAGGGGSATGASTVRTGGNGTGGIIVVEEYT